MSRKIHRLKNLQMAEFTAVGPFANDPKLKGKALEGIKYQAQVHREMQELAGHLTSEQWIKFTDNGKVHYCRPDSILVSWDRVVVVETKLSLRQLAKALSQLRLYKPLLERIFNKPVVCVVAFKHWVIGSQDCLPMIKHPEEIVTVPLRGLNKPLGWNYM